MRKLIILSLLSIFFFSCQEDTPQTTLSGHIKGLTNDTIYLYGADKSYPQVDTIICTKGKFSHTLTIDTITSATILVEDSLEYPVFLNKFDQIQIEGDLQDHVLLSITGNKDNEDLTAFFEEIQQIHADSIAELQQQAEKFIKTHNTSLASCYVFKSYFLQQATLNIAQLDSIVESMAGNLLDQPAMKRIQGYIKDAKRSQVGEIIPYFSYTNAKGKRVARASDDFRGKYIFINFWTSWNKDSRKIHAQLKDVYEKNKKNKHFNMMGISFDYDKAAWEKAIKEDEVTWEQVSNFKGLADKERSTFGIATLPDNLLLSSTGKIIARNISVDSLKVYLKEKINKKN